MDLIVLHFKKNPSYEVCNIAATAGPHTGPGSPHKAKGGPETAQPMGKGPGLTRAQKSGVQAWLVGLNKVNEAVFELELLLETSCDNSCLVI